jgi:hypothetical protein
MHIMTKWRRVALVAVLLVQSFTPALARYGYHHGFAAHHSRAHHLVGYDTGYYTAVSGHRVHRPVAADSRPSGATARCRDGSWSFSESHRGTCSWHGGVAAWL